MVRGGNRHILMRGQHHDAVVRKVSLDLRLQEGDRGGVERGEWFIEQPQLVVRAECDAGERRAPRLSLR